MDHQDCTPDYSVLPNLHGKLGLLHTALTEIGFAHDNPSALKAVLRLICEETGWVMGQAWLPDQDQKALTCDAVWVRSYAEELQSFIQISSQLRFRERQGILGRVLATGHAAWIDDITKDSDFRRSTEAKIAGLKTALAIPVLAGTEAIAVLEFFAFERRGHDDQLTVFLSTVASQLGWTLRHKRENDALKASEQRYRALVDNAPMCIHEIDQQRRLIAVNPAGLRMLGGVRESEVCGLSALNVVSPADQERIIRLLEDAFAGTVREFEFSTADQLGEARTFLSNFIPLRDEEGVVRKVLGTSQDITSYKKAEEQLRQSQRMEALGRLAGGIAHDFNNILNVIIGYAYLLNGNSSPDQVHQAADEIRKAADRATALTRQMLTFSRKQILQPEPRDLNAIMIGMSDMLRRLIGEDIELQVNAGKNVPHVVADTGQIEQILMNLAVNSRDAMPEGGQLTIATRGMEVGGDDAIRLALSPGYYAVLKVVDTGCGIEDKTQSHVFEPFFTTKEPGKGTGIGLATVYGIVRQGGGHVSLESVVGAGTTFTIYLPASERPAAEFKTPDVLPPAERGSETILLVEDENSLRRLTKQLLQVEGYVVLEAANASLALECASAYSGTIALLITDMVMPGMKGTELAQNVRRQRPGIKVLFITGYSDATLSVDDRTSVLEKPFTPEALWETVRSILSRSDERQRQDTDPPSLAGLSEGECA